MYNLKKIIPSPAFSTKREWGRANFRKKITSPTLVNLLKFYTPFLILLLIAGTQQVVPVPLLTRDIFATTQAPVYTGFLSNIGIFTWCVTFTVCIFTFFLIKPTNSQERKVKAFIGLSGLISLWMMIDDFFMLHEEVFPNIIGISEKWVMVVKLSLVFLHLIYFSKLILKSTPFKILALALLLFVCSLGVDFLPLEVDYAGNQSNFIFILEDGSKLIAIETWCFYFCKVCYQQITQFQKYAHLQ